jgi:hypothetical protein
VVSHKENDLPDEVRSFSHGEAYWKEAAGFCCQMSNRPLPRWCTSTIGRETCSGRLGGSAVVDFKKLALGDPAIDVAYCRMDSDDPQFAVSAAWSISWRAYEEALRRRRVEQNLGILGACGCHMRPLSASF